MELKLPRTRRVELPYGVRFEVVPSRWMHPRLSVFGWLGIGVGGWLSTFAETNELGLVGGLLSVIVSGVILVVLALAKTRMGGAAEALVNLREHLILGSVEHPWNPSGAETPEVVAVDHQVIDKPAIGVCVIRIAQSLKGQRIEHFHSCLVFERHIVYCATGPDPEEISRITQGLGHMFRVPYKGLLNMPAVAVTSLSRLLITLAYILISTGSMMAVPIAAAVTGDVLLAGGLALVCVLCIQLLPRIVFATSGPGISKRAAETFDHKLGTSFSSAPPAQAT